MADTVEAAAAPVETPAAEPETTSLADHEALFGAPDPTLEGDAKKANEVAREKVRHRARSQQASPEDAPRIQELTKRLRETEAERDRLKSQPARGEQSPGASAAPAGEAVASRPAATRPKPSVDHIGVEHGYATYEDYIEDLADWKAEQRDAAREARAQEAQQARQQSEQQQSWQKSHQTFSERRDAFKATHSDYDALLEQHGAVNIPAAPYQAILAAEHGPAWVYHLMSHPDQLAELALLFDGKSPTPEMIAHATRWLSGRAGVQSAPPAAPTLSLAPRPPNPVRTGAARADGDAPSDDSMSIEAHEKAFGRRRR